MAVYTQRDHASIYKSDALRYSRTYVRYGAWMQLHEDVPSPASLAPDELVELMADPHRCESAVVERKLAMIAELTDRRVAEHERTGGWTSTGVEIAESEIGAALTNCASSCRQTDQHRHHLA